MEDSPMLRKKRPHTSMQMKNCSIYLPVPLVEKARAKGLNLSACFERELHVQLQDLVFLPQIKIALHKQLDDILVFVNAEPQNKNQLLEELARLRQAIDKIEGDAFIRVEE